jgi:surface polysaccharide O-acyltransferase-like enzyme
LAVVYHSVGWSFVAMFWWAHRFRPVASPNFEAMYGAGYFDLRFLEQLVAFAIPAFLLVSGYFLAFAGGRTSSSAGWRVIGVRLVQILIPFFLWTLVMVGAQIAQGQSFDSAQLMGLFLLGQSTPAFYFIPLLVQLYLLAPILVALGRRSPAGLLLLSAAIQIPVYVLRYGMILGMLPSGGGVAGFVAAGWFFPGHVFWFALGIVIGLRTADFKILAIRFRGWALATVLILLPTGVLEWEWLLRRSGESWISPRPTLLDTVFSLAVLMLFLAAGEHKFPLEKRFQSLGTKSYGVYLAHSLVLLGLARLTYHFAPALLGLPLAFLALLVSGGLLGPLLLMTAIRHSPASGAYRYLFG